MDFILENAALEEAIDVKHTNRSDLSDAWIVSLFS